MLPIFLQNLNNLSKVNPIAQFSDFVVAKSFSLERDHSMITSTMPGFYKGSFKIDTINQVNDTYLSFSGWSKGIAFVNDFNLGRFWLLRGPQCNLYVPAPILRQGENIVVILELETPNIELVVTCQPS